jgi:hypothetical protein
MAFRVQQRIGVAAPASAVWKVIGDLDSWKEWNPLFTEAEGRLSIGSLVQLRRKVGDVGERQEVRVVDWVPDAQIIFSRSIGLFASSLIYLEIEPLTERGCILAVGELFEGRIGELLGARARKALNPAMLALCEAAKARAEATWDGVPDEPVPPPPPPPPLKMKGTQPMMFSMRGQKLKK